MSKAATEQVVAATGIECRRFNDYSRTAIWLLRWLKYDPAALRDLEKHATVYRGQPPFNTAIAHWARRRGGAPLFIPGLVKFAAVSALVYSTTWEYAIPPSLVHSGRFYGRDRASIATFLNGLGAVVQRTTGCERTSIQLEFGGVLRLSKVTAGGPRSAFACLAVDYSTAHVTHARYVIPRIKVTGRSDFTGMLKRLGAVDMFIDSANPFRRLQPELALDAVLQATDLRIDETGVGVRATTAAYTYLGIPHPKIVMTFDRPFVFQVLDGKHMPAALGVVNDL